MVDCCEKSQNKAYDINYNAVFSLSLEAKKIGAKTIYISTDYVFGGVLPIYGDKYMEEDTISQLNVYGQTKHRGEQFVLSISKDNLVVRTSSLFGPDKLSKNFPCQVVRKLKDNLKFPAFSHVVSTPTYTVDLAECIIQLLVHDCCGVMHLAGPESVSKYDWALKIANNFNLENTLIEKVDSFLALVAKRPLNSSLANNRIGNILPEFKFRGIQDALEDWMINFPDSLDDIVNPTKSKL
ncbi:Spore coat polysaccharide biosynthesis protein SpsK-like [Oopsacas minuta]|uniref:Methionine adenosyltransferase 2 subunit beta n=1 Tax=Oopsacas minuta TaxID=111878 RepID=A0AAV7JGC5_9METZ|nr:Spore coat polysaccharide biosynthesis protein SpsK-like [Oopsacas minuta]